MSEEDEEAAAAGSDQTDADRLSNLQEHVSLLAHLATFGIIGVLIRYGVEELFGPALGRVTDASSAMFIDLPANMLGCFFMGWVGIVLKAPLTDVVSEHLALGLSSGLMGSITTFASWSQSMLRVITAGYWLRGLFGFLIGLELAMMSLIAGVDTAALVFRIKLDDTCGASVTRPRIMKKSRRLRMSGLVLFMALSVGLWVMAFTLLFREQSYNRKKLWIACTLAPLGVWSRWWLSTLNGKGVMPGGHLVWLPTGTLSANVCASFAEFLLNILQLVKVITNRELVLASAGFQFGMLGCMSTVSTLVAELYWLHQQQPKWRAYAYASVSVLVTLAVGLVSFSTVAWLTRVTVNV